MSECVWVHVGLNPYVECALPPCAHTYRVHILCTVHTYCVHASSQGGQDEVSEVKAVVVERTRTLIHVPYVNTSVNLYMQGELGEVKAIMVESTWNVHTHSYVYVNTSVHVCMQGELSEVKAIMVENIEKVLERGEKLDLLVDKTDSLQVCTHTHTDTYVCACMHVGAGRARVRG